ncbi:hypothetical protein MMC10_007019 [Thelotrema lepadinum]|nr:hypothetical protein [Thelotrema lepadinum]
MLTFVSILTGLLVAASGAFAQDQYTATSPASVHAAQATALTKSPTSHVSGKAFDRIAIIWLENTDYSLAAGDPNLAWLAQKGITLENYFGVTHPSEPNYCASFGGDNFGMDNDNFNQIPNNVSSIIDLLDTKGISWGAYQEDMPFSGFEGFAWVNQKSGANDYVRKHNPPIFYDSVTDSNDRLAQIKNMTMFYRDLAENKLPQWMFITPNMTVDTDDGHDTSVTVAGTWTRNLLEPLLNNKNFMQRTLVLVTFDENHTYTEQNRVLAILLGDAVPSNLVGSKDSTFYDHYSEIATVEANWDLNTLGRWDVGANVFSVVANETGDKLRTWDAVTGTNPTVFLNESYAGPLNSVNTHVPFPAPNLTTTMNGRTVLPAVQMQWGSAGSSIYNDGIEIPDGMFPPQGY